MTHKHRIAVRDQKVPTCFEILILFLHFSFPNQERKAIGSVIVWNASDARILSCLNFFVDVLYLLDTLAVL